MKQALNVKKINEMLRKMDNGSMEKGERKEKVKRGSEREFSA